MVMVQVGKGLLAELKMLWLSAATIVIWNCGWQLVSIS